MKKLTILCAVVLSCLVALICYFAGDLRLGRQKLNALLKGDTAIRIARITTKSQQRRLECTDTQVLSYLAEALRTRTTKYAAVGLYSYEIHLKFRGGGTVEVIMEVGTNGFDLCSDSYARNPDQIRTHSLSATQADPPKLQQLLAFLAEPHDTAAGSELLLQDGHSPRRERAESLVAR